MFSGQASILKAVPSTSFFGSGLKKTNYNAPHTFTKENHLRVVVEIDEIKQTEKVKWKGIAYNVSDDQHYIICGKGMVESLFQAPMGAGMHNAIMSSYDYISTTQRKYISLIGVPSFKLVRFVFFYCQLLHFAIIYSFSFNQNADHISLVCKTWV